MNWSLTLLYERMSNNLTIFFFNNETSFVCNYNKLDVKHEKVYEISISTHVNIDVEVCISQHIVDWMINEQSLFSKFSQRHWLLLWILNFFQNFVIRVIKHVFVDLSLERHFWMLKIAFFRIVFDEIVVYAFLIDAMRIDVFKFYDIETNAFEFFKTIDN